MASLAKYDYLIFIDCDAKLVNNSFIKNYIDCIEKKKSVACGGLLYEKAKPQNHKLFFRRTVRIDIAKGVLHQKVFDQHTGHA